MTTADLVNRIIEKLGHRVRFVCIENDEEGTRVEFEHAGNFYFMHSCVFSKGECYVNRRVNGAIVDDAYSQWVSGVLNGKTRDKDGVLS